MIFCYFMTMKAKNVVFACAGAVAILFSSSAFAHGNWHVALHHDRDGKVFSGDISKLISSIRNGCNLRVAWGTKRASDPTQTIEHIATPIWVSVRNSETVEVQLDDYLINLNVLGEPPEDYPRRDRFGGTEKAVKWRASLKTDGSFNAVWYYAGTGAYVERVPQKHPMKWFVDCAPKTSTPLFQSN